MLGDLDSAIHRINHYPVEKCDQLSLYFIIKLISGLLNRWSSSSGYITLDFQGTHLSVCTNLKAGSAQRNFELP